MRRQKPARNAHVYTTYTPLARRFPPCLTPSRYVFNNQLEPDKLADLFWIKTCETPIRRVLAGRPALLLVYGHRRPAWRNDSLRVLRHAG